MSGKTVSLSVRVSDEDAEFLARLKIGDATTPSEKMRALLASERRLRAGPRDTSEASEMLDDLMRPARRRWRQNEEAASLHSEVLQRVYDRLPALAALALAGPEAAGEAGDAEAALSDFEGRVLDQTFALVEDLLQIALLREPRALNRASLKNRISTVIELAELAKMAQNSN
ncbi:hypothetical protein ACWCOP_04135 [Maricaulaceae bacterium MS644]